MSTRRLVITLALIVVMGMALVLCRAEARRLGGQLRDAQRIRDALTVQYERVTCRRSACYDPSLVAERVVAMGLELAPPGGQEELMYARAAR